jgi:hypothetical protein
MPEPSSGALPTELTPLTCQSNALANAPQIPHQRLMRPALAVHLAHMLDRAEHQREQRPEEEEKGGQWMYTL